jgi:AcrR family transcriptional regulator
MEGFDERLLAAGREVFRRYGYQGATAERIAQAAGVSRVTLHRRGIGKVEVLALLAEDATRRYRDAMWKALTASGNGRERLELALRTLCDSAEENLEVLLALGSQSDALFHEEEGRDGALTRDVFTEPLARLLRDGAADGSLRPVNVDETATLLFNAVGWTYIHLRSGHRWSARRARTRTIDLALNGLLPVQDV